MQSRSHQLLPAMLQFVPSDESMLAIMNFEEWEFLDEVAIDLGFGTKYIFLLTALEEYKLIVGQLGIMKSLHNLNENGKDWYIDTVHKLIFADGAMTPQEKLILDDIFNCMNITTDRIIQVAKNIDDEVNPDFEKAFHFYNEGLLKLIQKDYVNAIVEFNKSIDLYNKYPNAFLDRGNAKSAIADFTKDYKEAIADFTTAIELQSDNAKAYSNRGNAKMSQIPPDYEGAKLDLKDALRINPDLYQTYFNSGKLKFNQGKDSEAIDDFTKAISRSPKYSLAFGFRGMAKFNIGMARFNEKEVREALSDFDKAIEYKSQLEDNVIAEFYKNRGIIKNILGDFIEANADCLNAKKLNPDIDCQ